MDELYKNNYDFKCYVDKYMTKEKIDLQTALTHAAVRNYAEYIRGRGDGETKLRNMWVSAGAPRENVMGG